MDAIGVVIETRLGCLELAVYRNKAPQSACAFLALVDDGSFVRDGAFYRAVRKGQNDNRKPGIDVIQGGLLAPPETLPAIAHESTDVTGLRHIDGVVSLARGAVGTANGSGFFICIGDQPALDARGGRDPFADHQGFAAFGRIVRGMDTVWAIHRCPTTAAASRPALRGQMLDPPVRFTSAYQSRRFAPEAASWG
jgi:peptidyl-prolyl cis-trans isomerase A (cyclophilin A)